MNNINLANFRDLCKNGNKGKDRISGIIIILLKEKSNQHRLRTEKH